MSEKILVRGVPRLVRFETDTAEVWFGDHGTAGRGSGYVSHADAAKALDAMHAKREVEIVDVDGVRTVRLVPTVVVKARGTVCKIIDAEYDRSPRVGLRSQSTLWAVENIKDAQIRAEVEIVSIDGGPDMVRLVP